jgi:hypothetical protein
MGDFEHMRLEPWASAGRNQYLQSPVQAGKGANLLLPGFAVRCADPRDARRSVGAVLHREIPDAVLRH